MSGDLKKKGSVVSNPTEYVVLRQRVPELGSTDAATWTEVGKTKATNATQAIAKLAGDEPEGTHVATPARSWRPVKPTNKVETRTVWS